MIPRLVRKLLIARLEDYPAVGLVGPRQCGKTTLARSLKGAYFDLEQEPERLRLDLEWNHLVSGKELLILDEAQSWPDVFVRLRGTLDEDRKRTGRFLLLGSISPSLMEHVSESLAGRMSVVEMTPLLWIELNEKKTSGDRHWLCGGYPDGGILDPRRHPQWQKDYLTLLVQRDLPNWGLPARPRVIERLLKMLAAVHGQTWNASQIGQSLGLSYQTINTYLDYLEGAFLIRRLAPYQANLRKRLVKRPKIYWRDSGLLHALLNVPDRETLLGQPWVGASWEGFVIEQVIGALGSIGRPFDSYTFRTSDQYEIDLVLDFGKVRWAIEVKLTASPTGADMDGLRRTADLIRASRRFLITRTRTNAGDDKEVSCNLPWFLEELQRGF